jgi:hypothetical protein
MGRPFALSLRLIQPNVEDWEVEGWKAERDGRRSDALDAYNKALLMEPNNLVVKARRDNLLQQDEFSYPPLE